MTKLTIIYFSGYGHTEAQANNVAEGARSGGADVAMIKIPEDGQIQGSDWEALDASDAIIFGSPTYMGGPAWQFKRFADESSKRWFELKWLDKIAGGFTTSASINGDKYNTINYFLTLSQQHGQIWVGLGQMPANAAENSPSDRNWIGGSVGALAQIPADQGADAAREGDIKSAKDYGQRLAVMTARLKD